MKIGIDIVNIERIAKSLSRSGERFVKRFLNDDEIVLCGNRPQSIAGFWAAKEAALKALGCGFSVQCSFKDIKIFKSRKGAPKIKFSKKVSKKFKIKNSSLSITHDGGFAVAVVVLKRQ